jgi:serine O-acetyltransferase
MLARYVTRQLNTFFPDGRRIQDRDISPAIDEAIEKLEYCFSYVDYKYYPKNGESVGFNHLNSDHYAMFLYIISNSIFKESHDLNACTKLFLLNKCLHGIDVFYEVDLPDIFLFAHPVGTVLGRARYSDFLLVYHKCNVGANKGKYPILGKYLSLHPGSAVLGDCVVKKNCKIAAGSLLLDKNLGKNSVYIGNPQHYIIKKSSEKNADWACDKSVIRSTLTASQVQSDFAFKCP